MQLIWGIVVVLLALLCWGGQAIAWLAPNTAVKLTLMESEEAVEPTYWADIRGEALWDALTLWAMVVAGALMIVDSAAWPHFGLVGGGMYLYFAGRGISTRVAMQRRSCRIGDPQSVKIGYAFLAIWGVMASITIVASAVAL